ncbi:hypothetical protein LJK88_29905 [Paenibacillus sp. P26]|nr:hypothetical protein LJK88_29905 [Paenibacillus sp. P26]UUZ94507.1 hypothetical protein LJK87_08155 [Paenibacillus sp. P25]
MASGFSIGYLNFTAFLLLLSGIGMLRLDVKSYEKAKMEKERKTARFLGWFNIALGIVVYIGDWIYRNTV